MLKLNSLGADCGISQPTARQWLTVLQASHLVALLPPYHRNFGKRLVKAPKLYFLDSGLLCYLMRIASPDDLTHHALRGAIFEVSETLKHRFNCGLTAGKREAAPARPATHERHQRKTLRLGYHALHCAHARAGVELT